MCKPSICHINNSVIYTTNEALKYFRYFCQFIGEDYFSNGHRSPFSNESVLYPANKVKSRGAIYQHSSDVCALFNYRELCANNRVGEPLRGGRSMLIL